MAAAEERAKLNQSVKKAITLLRATADDRNANVSSLARAAGLPRATALRMIQTLEQEGFLLRIPGDDRVLLGPELVRLARNTDEQLLLREVSRPIVSDLVATVRETVTLSVVAPDGGLDVVSQVDAPAQLRPQSWVGQRFPLHASASGKVLLATYDDERLGRFLAEPLARFTPSTITSAEELRAELGLVREQRYAVSRDEEEEGLSGLSTRIHGPGDELLGVLSLGGPTQRLDRQRGRRATEHLMRAAGEIESVLRRGRTPSTVLEVIGRAGG
ncbi:IclR family transcriptional regulator [Pseudonocardia sp.]|uniref:IclR family transcriptional regulator n=1 Tax=Pseudonocardia sp. TaxID=60912 RepID=UPI003D0AB61C